MWVRLPLRAPSAMLLSNLLGTCGLAAVVVAVGALTGSWWWSVLLGGALLVAVAWVLHQGAATAAALQQQALEVRDGPAPAVPPAGRRRREAA